MYDDQHKIIYQSYRVSRRVTRETVCGWEARVG